MKRIDDMIPPCCAPLETVRDGEIVLPHLMQVTCFGENNSHQLY